MYTTFSTLCAAVVIFAVTVIVVLLFSGGTLKAIFIVSFESTASGVAFTVTPSLLFPLMSIVFTVNVYSVPFVRLGTSIYFKPGAANTLFPPFL